MSTAMEPHEPPRIYRVDKFKVPAAARAEFLDQVKKTHELLRRRPGFVHDAILEQTDGLGQFNVVTIATWQVRAAFEAARAAVTARHEEMRFNPREILARLWIEADLASYQELGEQPSSL